MTPIFKQNYRGYGIYWHGDSNYGDETNIHSRSLMEARQKIDLYLQKQEENKPDHLKYWDMLTHEQRTHWRKACMETNYSASELAYQNR